MKKVIAIVTSIILLFGMISPALAQGESAKISQDEALKIARDTFGISEKLGNVQIGYREDNYFISKKVWEFNWDLSLYRTYRNIRVEVDAENGEIISYNESEDWQNKKAAGKSKTREECKKIAEKFIAKLAPQKLNEIKEKQNSYPYLDYYGYGPKTYYFSYERQINGIPFPENNLWVTVNAENGKIIEYRNMWDNNLSFPEAGQVITPEQAEKIFCEEIGLRLSYFRPFKPYLPIVNKKIVEPYYLVWDYMAPVTMISALDGKIIDQTGKETTVQKRVYLTSKEEPAPNEAGKALTLEEAKAKVSQYINIPSEYILQSSRYTEGWGEPGWKIWEFQYSPKDYRDGEPFNVNINAVTGELANYNQWGGPSEERRDHAIKFDYNKCKQIAIDFLNKVASEKKDYVYLFESTQPQLYISNGKAVTPPTYNFNFIRVVNGVPFTSNNISVDIDNETGKVRSYLTNWEPDAKFADIDSVMSEKEALDKLFAAEKPRLIYKKLTNEDGSLSKKVVLIYVTSPENASMVNALNGEISSTYDAQKTVKLDDIDGHWAEREIRMLGAWEIIAGSNGRFNPDRAITRAEFVHMLVTAKGLEAGNNETKQFIDVKKTSWYYNSVQAAVQAGLIKGYGNRFEPDQTITRQEMAVILINAINVSDRFGAVNDFSVKFKDENKVAGWAKKAVIMAVETGLLSGNNSCLKPDSPATRAEAAVMLLKAIENNR